MPRFAANLGYLFTDRPLLERIDAAAAAGFKAVELQFPYDVPADAVKAAHREKPTHHSRPQYAAGRARASSALLPCRDARRTGRRCSPERSTMRARLARSAIHCLAGKVAAGAASGRRSCLYRQSDTCGRSRCREKNQAADRTDQRPRPAELFSQSRRARCRHHRQSARPNIRMQFDFYHVQIVGGDLIHRLEKFLPADRTLAMRGGAITARTG